MWGLLRLVGALGSRTVQSPVASTCRPHRASRGCSTRCTRCCSGRRPGRRSVSACGAGAYRARTVEKDAAEPSVGADVMLIAGNRVQFRSVEESDDPLDPPGHDVILPMPRIGGIAPDRPPPRGANGVLRSPSTHRARSTARARGHSPARQPPRTVRRPRPGCRARQLPGQCCGQCPGEARLAQFSAGASAGAARDAAAHGVTGGRVARHLRPGGRRSRTAHGGHGARRRPGGARCPHPLDGARRIVRNQRGRGPQTLETMGVRPLRAAVHLTSSLLTPPDWRGPRTTGRSLRPSIAVDTVDWVGRLVCFVGVGGIDQVQVTGVTHRRIPTPPPWPCPGWLYPRNGAEPVKTSESFAGAGQAPQLRRCRSPPPDPLPHRPRREGRMPMRPC